jgi:hypothetical protein
MVSVSRDVRARSQLTRRNAMLATIDCFRKRSYSTHEEAQEVARHQMELHPGRLLRVYRCDHGGHYHLTHKSKRI